MIQQPTIQQQSHKLLDFLKTLPNAVVAFSGGVDSAVVAKAAFLALQSNAVAITGYGAAVSQQDRIDAADVAKQIGIRHIILSTDEISDPNYIANDARRCYHCKSHLYATLRNWGAQNGFHCLLSGTNLDDLGDYRPGLEAAQENEVRAPLAELSFGKEIIRSLAAHWNLSVADKPASPCLASRIAYGESVSVDRLRRIEEGEKYLRAQGFQDVRVRLHEGELARIEIPKTELGRCMSEDWFEETSAKFRSLGFRHVTLDLAGLQSGSLNRSLQILHR